MISFKSSLAGVFVFFLFFVNVAYSEEPRISQYQSQKPGRERALEQKKVQLKAEAARTDCSTYDEELAELKLNRKLVDSFRKDYLMEHTKELLDQFMHLWNHVHKVWEQASPGDKKFVADFRNDWRQRVWYHKKDDAFTRETGLADLRDEYRIRFKSFVEKYFVTERFHSRGWSFQIRKGEGGIVFPVGSVIELEDGELSVARNSRLKLPDEMGGFILHLKIRNDVYASKIKVVSQRGNFRSKSPDPKEVLESARRWARVDDNDPKFEVNEDRLELLLDPRFERCPENLENKTQKKSTPPNPQ
jgi:hypothetical protein